LRLRDCLPAGASAKDGEGENWALRKKQTNSKLENIAIFRLAIPKNVMEIKLFYDRFFNFTF